MRSKSIQKITHEAIEQLIAAVQAGKSQTLRNYLEVMARFHQYSLLNLFLIARQSPAATRVAGFRAWLSLGRQVKKGERGIAILAPLVQRKGSDRASQPENASRILGFRTVFVFDVSQTEGRALPTIGTAQGEPGEYAIRLEQFVREQGICLEESAEIAPARGASWGGKIVLAPGLGPAERFSTLAHELAHELLHRDARRDETTRRIRETEAEAVAFVLCQAIGLETGSAAGDYIQLYNGDARLLTESLEAIHKTSNRILESLDRGQPVAAPPEAEPSRARPGAGKALEDPIRQ